MSNDLLNLVWASDIGPLVQRVTLAVLADAANAAGECWPYLDTIAARVGAARSTVSAALTALAADGLITKRRRRGQPSLYRVDRAALLARRKTAREDARQADPAPAEEPATPPSDDPESRNVQNPELPQSGLGKVQNLDRSKENPHRTPKDGAGKPAAPPSKLRKGKRRPSTAMPSGWQPTEEHRKRAAALGLVLAVEADEFRAWTGAKDARYVDWNLAFTNHLIGNGKRAAHRSQRPPAAPTVRPSGLDEAREWLRGEWTAYRTTRITELTGLRYVEGNLPPGHTAAEAKAWHDNHRREWITAHSDQILARLTEAS